MIDEMRKFYKNPAIIFLFVFAILLSILGTIFFICDYESYDYSTGKEIVIRGLDGLRNEKARMKKTSGVLDTDKLGDALEFYKSLPKGETAYFEIEEKHPGIFLILKEAYSPFAGENAFQPNNISYTDDFYNRHVEKVKEKTKAYGFSYLSNLEKKEASQRALDINEPFKFGFIDQWPILIKSLIFVYFIIVFSAMIVSSQLFSFEKEQNMDMILGTTGGKKLVSIGLKKIWAMVSYLTVEFILCNAIVLSIMFSFIGFAGWDSQIQIIPGFFTMVYDWTIGEMMIYYILTAWISILSIGLIGACINSIFQNTYISLIISSLLIVTPMLLKDNSFTPVYIQRILYAQPINGINLLSYIDSLFSYNIGFKRVLTSTMISILSIVYSIGGIILSPRLFADRINKM